MNEMKQGGFLIAKIHQVGGRIFSRLLRDADIEINPAQGRILFVLWRNDGIMIQELAKQTSLGKSTLTSMLDRLEEAGFIQRVRSTEDRRQILIQRTEKDKTFQKAYETVSNQMKELFYRGFSEKEIARFEDYLNRILTNLTQSENDPS
jgi:MarR family transcriptional regulator, organic hydroperoxide resistance regulator